MPLIQGKRLNTVLIQSTLCSARENYINCNTDIISCFCLLKVLVMKLRRLLEYLRGTMDMVLTLGADDLNSLHTWVDASYAVHPDMRSHTGGVISLGTGAVLCKSAKQKLTTKSSTEAELVGSTDYNMSAIKLEKNGRSSAGRQSRHIDIRYFFLKDRI
jgi:hypothetical protein